MGKDTGQKRVPENNNELKLTSGEILIILRRRENLAQEDMAKRIQVNLSQYKRMEYDLLDSPKMSYGKLQPHEMCYIMRRRAGRKCSQLYIARKLKYSRWWINQMERGKINCEPLLQFWGI